MLEVPDVHFIRHCGVAVLLFFIVAWTCVVVSVMLVVCSLSVFLSMCLFVLCVLCLTGLVNCLLNAFAICVGEMNVFSVLFLCFMCSGCSLHVECILTFGMLCLSAWRMMFVKMVFAVCMSGGG